MPKHFRGTLKPPFNVSARAAAAMTEDWYVPLSIRTAVHEKTILSKDKRNGKIDESGNEYSILLDLLQSWFC